MIAIRMIAEQLQELQQRFRQGATERVEPSLAHTSIRLAAQFGRKEKLGILIDLTLTRQDLAEISGTTLYTVGRLLRQWERQGLVATSRQRERDQDRILMVFQAWHAVITLDQDDGRLV